MFKIKFTQVLWPLVLVTVAACAGETDTQLDEPNAFKLSVYKSPTCGCCGEWVEHIEDNGFQAKVFHPYDLNAFKTEKSIDPSLRSCHTAVSADGYVFEGHIPAKTIQAFLDNPPQNAIGLAVPGMPVGSPGMEMGDKFSPYKVLLLKQDGATEVFAEINTSEEQH